MAITQQIIPMRMRQRQQIISRTTYSDPTLSFIIGATKRKSKKSKSKRKSIRLSPEVTVQPSSITPDGAIPFSQEAKLTAQVVSSRPSTEDDQVSQEDYEKDLDFESFMGVGAVKKKKTKKSTKPIKEKKQKKIKVKKEKVQKVKTAKPKIKIAKKTAIPEWKKALSELFKAVK